MGSPARPAGPDAVVYGLRRRNGVCVDRVLGDKYEIDVAMLIEIARGQRARQVCADQVRAQDGLDAGEQHVHSGFHFGA
ncbi:MAG: hypothetical protein Q8P31_13305 [Bacillota bacterium]|nr:hypothetical protein [Bacillota bacterium]